jgi:hypothetical protein
MRTTIRSATAVFAVALPLFAGALVVEIGDPAANPEALSKHAVLVARTTACHSPEKTLLTATAEGVIDGQRRTIPLNLIPLSPAGSFAVTHQWPSAGIWAIKIVARNPEYRNYATGALVRFNADSIDWASLKHYFHEPTGEEVAGMLGIETSAANASLTNLSIH